MKEMSHLSKMSLENLIMDYGVAAVLNHVSTFVMDRRQEVGDRESFNSINCQAMARTAKVLIDATDDIERDKEYIASERKIMCRTDNV